MAMVVERVLANSLFYDLNAVYEVLLDLEVVGHISVTDVKVATTLLNGIEEALSSIEEYDLNNLKSVIGVYNYNELSKNIVMYICSQDDNQKRVVSEFFMSDFVNLIDDVQVSLKDFLNNDTSDDLIGGWSPEDDYDEDDEEEIDW